MMTRREFGKYALATVPAATVVAGGPVLRALAQAAKPNSLFNGVQIGTITYSYRSMPEQSAEATLKYIVESGISAVELMGGPVNDYARKRTGFTPSAGGRGGGGGGRAGGRGAAEPGAPAGWWRRRGRGEVDPATLTASWNGVPCAPGREGGAARAAGAPAAAPPAGAPAACGRRRRAAAAVVADVGKQTPEQQARPAAAEEERKWRMGLSMDIFKDLRKMYNDAGVSIYAVKDVRQGTDEDLEYTFAVAEALGANHVTLELPSGPNAAATLKRLGDWGLKKKIYVAYHTHAQGSMTGVRRGLCDLEGQHGEHRLRPLGRGRQRRRHADAVPREVPRPDFELPSEGPHDSAELHAESRVGHRRDPDQGDPPARQEEQVEDPGVD